MQQLSSKEFAAIGASPDALAQYLSTLTPEQIRQYMSALSSDTSMPPAVRQTLLKLFTQLEAEAERNQTLITETLMPLAVGIATAMKLLQQIESLEALERAL